MDILVKTQATADIIIIVPLVINTGAPDTGATLTIKAIKPDGTEDGAFTAPTVTEIVAGGGVYKLVFPTNAATKLFTLTNEHNPYTLLVKTATSGSTGYRAIRIYCVDRLPGELALATALATVDTVVDGIASDLAVVGGLVADLTTDLATVDTVVDGIAVDLAVVDGLVDTLTTNLATVDTLVDALPTLAEIEASTVLAKEATTLFTKKCLYNKKMVKETSLGSGVFELIIYDDNDTTPLVKKVLFDIDGNDIAEPGNGVIAQEIKSSV